MANKKIKLNKVICLTCVKGRLSLNVVWRKIPSAMHQYVFCARLNQNALRELMKHAGKLNLITQSYQLCY